MKNQKSKKVTQDIAKFSVILTSDDILSLYTKLVRGMLTDVGENVLKNPLSVQSMISRTSEILYKLNAAKRV